MPDLPTNRCAGVKRLNSAASNSADRKLACGCLKSAYQSNPGINSANAASLPSKCGVSIPYKISPNTDCSKYVFIIKNTHKYLTHSKRSLIHHWSERNKKGKY
ncbi:putative plant lipid transfer protein/Par allergen [Helianthus anomalus]